MLMASPTTCSSREALVRLWLHEASRVFADRLVCEEDRSQLQHMLVRGGVPQGRCSSLVRGPESLFCHLYLQIELSNKHDLGCITHAEAFVQSSIAWGDFLRPGLEREQRRYEEVTNWPKVHSLLQGYLDDYNSSHASSMDLVFFQTAVDHICRLCRVLRQVCRGGDEGGEG
jgi:dynein heavy chain